MENHIYDTVILKKELFKNSHGTEPSRRNWWIGNRQGQVSSQYGYTKPNGP